MTMLRPPGFTATEARNSTEHPERQTASSSQSPKHARHACSTLVWGGGGGGVGE